MWHEARKHEKKIRGIMIDHRRRAEKRREFYESIRKDPASFLQIHGQQMKIHIDPIISQTAESSLVPWMCDDNNLIDRFDVRANLDCLPTSTNVETCCTNDNDDGLLTSDQECQLNYERFRNLVQNDFVDNNEQKVLHRIFLKEKWGQQQQQQTNNAKTKNALKRKLAEKKTAIGYNYDDGDGKQSGNDDDDDDETSSESRDDSDDEEFEDLDTIVFVDQLDPDMCERINVIAKKYGIKSEEFIKFMQADKAEADRLRIAKEIENEKSMFVGRKSRRERKVLIQQRLLILRSINADDCEVDHFAAAQAKRQKNKSNSSSSNDEDDDDSKSEIEEGKIEFITSFGNEEDEIVDEKKLKKVDRKSWKESNKKKSKHISAKQDSSSNNPQIFGPSLPIDIANFKVESTNSISKMKSCFTNKTSNEGKFSFERSSPSYTVRRSPSVRRRYSSDDSDSSGHSIGHRHRSTNRRRLSPPSRYRSRSRSHSLHKYRRSRSRSPPRRNSSYRNRKRSRSKSPIKRRSDRRSSGHKEKGKCSSQSPKTKDVKLDTNDDNMKLYKLLEKIESNAKKCKKDETFDTKNKNTISLKEEKEKSPPIKRYYRHDLVDSQSDDHSDDDNSGEKT
ncbi:Alternative splicing regulator-like protein [Euroglyphus maynei]|uniref:Alternative splicing regulator-like protein n=1 Tax=Euroglyphus maynei TaxID=6958 RepID=A0A1Y3BB10_EURMA|nr:Alternative splicing regulator-like protein [Euroglyphus maynei]